MEAASTVKFCSKTTSNNAKFVTIALMHGFEKFDRRQKKLNFCLNFAILNVAMVRLANGICVKLTAIDGGHLSKLYS